jgi:hypothetical protein
MTDELHVIVDKATFLEVGRVLKRVFRHAGKQVVLTLGNGCLLIEFNGGGCEYEAYTSENVLVTTAMRIEKALDCAWGKLMS